MSISTKAIRSAGWASLSSYIQLIITFGSNILLSRLLVPEDFGTFALALSILMFVFMLAGFGAQESIIQCRDPKIEDLFETAFLITIAMSAALAIIGTMVGLITANFYGHTISLIVITISWIRFITNIDAAYAALLKRRLEYRPIALISMLSTFISLLVGIGLAILGFGVWSLVGRELISSLVRLVGFKTVTKYSLSWKFNIRTATWIWSFGWRMLLARITEVLFGQLDNYFVGTFLGVHSLGHYALAYRQAITGQQVTQGAIHAVIFSTFSDVQNSVEKLRSGFEKMIYWLWRLTLPLGVLVAVTGYDLVAILYGSQWLEAADIFRNLAIFMVFLPMDTAMKNFLSGAGQINLVITSRAIQLIVFVPGVVISCLWFTSIHVAWTVGLSAMISACLMLYQTNSLFKVSWRHLFLNPLIATICSGIVGIVIRPALQGTMPLFSVFFLSCSIITFTYVAVLLSLEYSTVVSQMNFIRLRIRTKAR